jgi:hypothetical protein
MASATGSRKSPTLTLIQKSFDNVELVINAAREDKDLPPVRLQHDMISIETLATELQVAFVVFLCTRVRSDVFTDYLFVEKSSSCYDDVPR